MKIATNIGNWNGYARAHEKVVDPKQFIREARKAGCAGVEISKLEDHFAAPQEALAFIHAEGLEIAAWQGNVTYNPFEPNIQQYRRSLEYAASLGVKTVMTCGGFPITPRRNTYPFDYDMFASSIGPMVDFAADLGMTIAYHPHRGCICETIRETEAIMERVQDLRLCVDIAHLAASGEDPVAFIHRFGDGIIYSHIKDYSWAKDSFMELGKGDGDNGKPLVRVAECIKALTENGYDGWLTLELDRKWTAALPTPVESTKESIAFLKELPESG